MSGCLENRDYHRKLLCSGGGDWAIRTLKIDSKKRYSVVLMGILKSKSEYIRS